MIRNRIDKVEFSWPGITNKEGSMKKDRVDFYQDILFNKLKELYSAIEEKRVDGIKDFEEAEPDIYDLCVQSYTKEQLYSLCERDRQALTMVEEALGKIRTNSYGLCEECEEPINEKRLEALPWVKLCINCQSKKEEEIAA
jgi:DnaK suppressor protein